MSRYNSFSYFDFPAVQKVFNKSVNESQSIDNQYCLSVVFFPGTVGAIYNTSVSGLGCKSWLFVPRFEIAVA